MPNRSGVITGDNTGFTVEEVDPINTEWGTGSPPGAGFNFRTAWYKIAIPDDWDETSSFSVTLTDHTVRAILGIYAHRPSDGLPFDSQELSSDADQEWDDPGTPITVYWSGIWPEGGVPAGGVENGDRNFFLVGVGRYQEEGDTDGSPFTLTWEMVTSPPLLNQLYAVTFDYSPREFADLYRINMVSGEGIPVGSTNEVIVGIAYDRLTQTMYGISDWRSENNEDCLFTISLVTGEVTLVGELGTGYISDLTFGPDGRLFGFDGNNETGIWVIDTDTGWATSLGSGIPADNYPNTALTFDNNGVLWGFSDRLYAFDPDTGETIDVGAPPPEVPTYYGIPLYTSATYNDDGVIVAVQDDFNDPGIVTLYSAELPSPVEGGGSPTLTKITDLAQSLIFGMEWVPSEIPLQQTPDWTLASTAGPEDDYPAMCWDPVRGRIVMLATSGDTYTWDGNSWELLSITGDSPGAREESAMAWDPIREEIVLYGGWSSYGDTWTLSGNTWTEKTGLIDTPGDMYEHTMAWSEADGMILLFGDDDTNTWGWNGTEWVDLAPVWVPWEYGSYGSRAAVDENGTVWWVFGLDDNDLTLVSYWDSPNHTWVDVITPTTPTGDQRGGFACAFVPGRGIVVWGGYNYYNEYTDTTWVFANGDWSELVTATTPTLFGNYHYGDGVSAAWDPVRRQLVMHGSDTSAHDHETWVLKL